MVQGGARASEWLLPSSVESTQVLGLKSCPAAGLHNRNAAGPGYHISEVARTGFLVFRVNPELRRDIQQIADEEQRTITQVCEMLLHEGVEAYKKEGPKFIQRLVAKQKARVKDS